MKRRLGWHIDDPQVLLKNMTKTSAEIKMLLQIRWETCGALSSMVVFSLALSLYSTRAPLYKVHVPLSCGVEGTA